MANMKRFVTHGPDNETVVLVVQRMSDDQYLQSGTGAFGASESIITMDNVLDVGGNDFGYYEHLEDRTVWEDGYYRIFMGYNTGTGVYDGLSAYILRMVGDVPMEGANVIPLAVRQSTTALLPAVQEVQGTISKLAEAVNILTSRVSSFRIDLLRGKDGI